MEKICVHKDNGEWCWFNHHGMYNWDNEDYEIMEVPDTYSVEDVKEYLVTYENSKNTL